MNHVIKLVWHKLHGIKKEIKLSSILIYYMIIISIIHGTSQMELLILQEKLLNLLFLFYGDNLQFIMQIQMQMVQKNVVKEQLVLDIMGSIR